jgi:hypothetical protein
MVVAKHPMRKLRIAGLGAVAASAALLSLGAGAAYADELYADPAAVEGGVRSPGGQGEVRASDIGSVNAQGDVRGSDIAVPVVKGGSPPPGNLAELGYDCLFSWSQFCQ